MTEAEVVWVNKKILSSAMCMDIISGMKESSTVIFIKSYRRI